MSKGGLFASALLVGASGALPAAAEQGVNAGALSCQVSSAIAMETERAGAHTARRAFCTAFGLRSITRR
jgi:hypothetical protein